MPAENQRYIHWAGSLSIPWTVLADESLSSPNKLILGAIAQAQDPFGYTTCTNRYLGIFSSQSDETVRSHLSKLIYEGRIERAFKDNKRRLRINPEFEWGNPCGMWDPSYHQDHDFRAFV